MTVLVKWRSGNTSHNIIKLLLLGEMNLTSIFIRLYHLLSVYLENTDVSCVRPRWNSSLPMRPHPGVSNGKAKINADSR